MSLCLGSLFCSIDHLSVFCASITLLWLLWTLSIVWSLGWLCFLLLFFFLWIALAIMDLLWFHINFRIICSSSVKSIMGNLILLVSQLCLTLCEPMDCSLLGSSLFMGFSKQEYWSGLPFPLQGIFLDQGSSLGLLHCRQILYHLSHQGSWIALNLQGHKFLKFIIDNRNLKWQKCHI